jgi:hypothetical protein
MAEFGAERIAIELGHHHVEQDQVGLLGDRELQTGFAIGGGLRAIAFGIENVAQRDAHGVLVVYDENTRAGIWS